ncbi:sigma-70 family RNA polymerase sigma factor [Brevibacillus sp. NL20B1]|uniref:sigma-70 family RNA polymerase sigma factor n=1 Tax=Brevibacillus sp. NL20B1 TaxID=2829799 RepID=UPI001BA3F381|nr:sigma-70 family RNA polymerase sigma factor [Brevibacillus sp. NL20B1]MBR8661172.1 sigma-70 family RNA polymerase sigma factor [Brevibacillus sp. NL20B1]
MDTNALVFKFQETGNSEVFRELYDNLKPIIEKCKRYYISRYNLDEHDVISEVNVSVWTAARSFKGGDFVGLLRQRIRSRIIDLIRKVHKPLTGEDECSYLQIPLDAATIELGEDFHRQRPQSTEEVAIKRRDQRHLISSLVAKSDDFTKKVVRMLPSYDSPTALATELGVNHSKVIRALDRLRRSYDATRLGELSDYLSA